MDHGPRPYLGLRLDILLASSPTRASVRKRSCHSPTAGWGRPCAREKAEAPLGPFSKKGTTTNIWFSYCCDASYIDNNFTKQVFFWACQCSGAIDWCRIPEPPRLDPRDEERGPILRSPAISCWTEWFFPAYHGLVQRFGPAAATALSGF